MSPAGRTACSGSSSSTAPYQAARDPHPRTGPPSSTGPSAQTASDPRPGPSSTRPFLTGRWSRDSPRTCRYLQIQCRCCRRCPRGTGSATSRTETSRSARRLLPAAGRSCRRLGASQCCPAFHRQCRYARGPSSIPACRPRNAHRIRDAGIMLFPELVVRRIGIRIAPEPELLDELVALLVVGPSCLNACNSVSVMIQWTSSSTHFL